MLVLLAAVGGVALLHLAGLDTTLFFVRALRTRVRFPTRRFTASAP